MEKLNSQQAFNILVSHFMGDKFFVMVDVADESTIPMIVNEIVKKYPKGKIRRIKDQM